MLRPLKEGNLTNHVFTHWKLIFVEGRLPASGNSSISEVQGSLLKWLQVETQNLNQEVVVSQNRGDPNIDTKIL